MISLQNISKSYGTKDLFIDLNLRIGPGDRIGMIGSNGTGKTTLARIIIGTESHDKGEVSRTKSWKLGFLAQEIDEIDDKILHDFVEGGKPQLVKARLELEKYEELIQHKHDEETQMAYAEALAHFEEAGGYIVEAEVDRILHGLGFTSGEGKRRLKTFSGGWIMRAALARLLFQEPDLLILDEPTNHLDLPALTWLEGFLKEWKGAYLVISHDRTFLNSMVEKIIEFDHGQLYSYVGNYDAYLAQKEQQQEIQEATRKNQEQRISQVERFIEKNRAHKSRARQVGSRKKMLELLEAQKVDIPKQKKVIKFTFPQPERSGTPTLKLEKIDKAYGDIVVYRGMNFEVARGEKVALVGPNGAGKSTLLKIASGVLKFEAGERKLGHNVSTHYFAQHQLEALNATKTPLQEMSALPGWDRIAWLRSLLGALLLGEKEIETNISDLSGGEKAKLALAKMLLNPANLILMDEPTNHLDPQAREVLEDALTKYSGTLIFISHDRTFINKIAKRVVEVDDGQMESFIGNYDDFLRARARQEASGSITSSAPRVQQKTSKVEVSSAKVNKTEEKERKRQEAALRNERRKATSQIKKKIKGIEDKIAATEKKLEDIHQQYSQTGLPADKYAELGKESRAVSEYVQTLYQQWEEASTELEEAEQKFK